MELQEQQYSQIPLILYMQYQELPVKKLIFNIINLNKQREERGNIDNK